VPGSKELRGKGSASGPAPGNKLGGKGISASEQKQELIHAVKARINGSGFAIQKREQLKGARAL